MRPITGLVVALAAFLGALAVLGYAEARIGSGSDRAAGLAETLRLEAVHDLLPEPAQSSLFHLATAALDGVTAEMQSLERRVSRSANEVRDWLNSDSDRLILAVALLPVALPASAWLLCAALLVVVGFRPTVGGRR
jgi:hypothetical protein